ncbi:hypothetical protein Aduo_003040 [Ancylostoma duodenale]
MSVLSVHGQQPFSMLACAVAAASGIALYYYCNSEQESSSYVDPGREYGVRYYSGVRKDGRVWNSTRQDSEDTAVSQNRQRNADRPRSRLSSHLSTDGAYPRSQGYQSRSENRTTTGGSTLLTGATSQDNESVTSSGTRVQTVQTGVPSPDQLLRTARSDDDAHQGKRRVRVYTKQSYERNVQRTTSSTDPKNLQDTTGQSVRLIPVAIENPQVHNVQRHVDTQFIDGKHVKIERKNEEIMRESIREQVKAVNK